MIAFYFWLLICFVLVAWGSFVVGRWHGARQAWNEFRKQLDLFFGVKP